MTLSTPSNRNDYVGTGTTGPFPFLFPIRAATDLEVRKYTVATDAETVLTLGVDYTVAGVGEATGGSVALVAALNNPDRLILRRIRPVTQGTSIRNQGDFFPEIHEDAFDHQVMIDQQHAEILGRAVQLPVATRPSDGISPNLPTPQANYALGWDATAKKLVNIAAGGRGPAGVGGPIPIFDDAAARDAFYPAPAVDNAAIVKALGYSMRFGAPASGGNKWLAEGITRAAGPVVAAVAKGAFGDGAHDDRAFLAAADTACASSGRAELDPGTYLVNADLTLSAHWHILRGALLKPAAGVTITILGHVTAGNYKWMDFSLGGLFSTRGNKSIHEYSYAWFGVVGDNTAADDAAHTSMVNTVDDYSTLIVPPNYTMRLTGEWRTECRFGLHFRSPIIPFPNAVAPAPQYAWDGHQGVVGFDAVMALNSRTLNAATGAFTANMVGQSIWLVGAGAFGAALRTTIAQYVSATQVVLSQKAKTAVTNVEYHAGGVMIFLDRCYNCRFTGFTFWIDQNQLPATRANALVGIDIDGYTGDTNTQSDTYETCLNTTNGSTSITSTGALFRPSQFGQNINIPGAGGGGGALNTTIKRVLSATQIVVALAPSATLVATTGSVFGQIAGGSACVVDWCFFGQNHQHKDFVGVSLSTTAQSNQEYHIVEHCHFQGQGDEFLNLGTTISIANGTPNAIASAPVWQASDVGRRIRIHNGGAPASGLATVLDTTILAFIDSQHVTLNANAGAAVVAGPWIIGQGYGTGVKIGSSFNAKRQTVSFCDFSNLRSGITLLAGSLISTTNNFFGNEIDHELLGSSEPSTIFYSNSEASRQHLVTSQADPVTLIGCRMAPLWGKANGGYIEPFAGGFSSGPVTVDGCLFDQSPVTGNAIFDLGGSGGFTKTLTIRSCRFNFITEAQLFRRYGGVGYKVVRQGLINMDGPQPAIWLQGSADLLVEASGVSVANGFKSTGAITGRNRPTNGAQDAYGVLGQSDSDAVGANRCVGLRGEAGTLSTRTQFTTEFVGVEGVMPTITGDPTVLSTGLSVQPPVVSSGALTTARGLRIPLMKQPGVTAGQGIQQEGASDTNLITGLTTFGTGIIEKATVYIDITAGGSAQPNPAGAKNYRYRIAGAATINAPINAVDGITFTMEIFNNTGGAITPALNGIFLGTGYGAIGAGKSRTRRWVYDGNVAAWKPIGAVSEDF